MDPPSKEVDSQEVPSGLVRVQGRESCMEQGRIEGKLSSSAQR